MIIGTSSISNIGSSYTIKLNEEESLEFKKEKIIQSPEEVKKQEMEELEKKSSVHYNPIEKLTEGEKELLKKLTSRDAEVREHEAAHQSVGGAMTGAASFSYQQGPDGKMYAISGEVSISMKSASTPQETISKAKQIQAAAMAAGEPSSQDFAVASTARVIQIKAQHQLSLHKQKENVGMQTYQDNIQTSDAKKAQTQPLEFIDISA